MGLRDVIPYVCYGLACVPGRISCRGIMILWFHHNEYISLSFFFFCQHSYATTPHTIRIPLAMRQSCCWGSVLCFSTTTTTSGLGLQHHAPPHTIVSQRTQVAFPQNDSDKLCHSVITQAWHPLQTYCSRSRSTPPRSKRLLERKSWTPESYPCRLTRSTH